MLKVIFISLIVLSAFARSPTQADDKLNLPVIDETNAHELQEIARWESVGTGKEWAGYPLADFSPDGKILAIAQNDGRIQFLSTDTLELVRTLDNADILGDALIFSQDGTRLLMMAQNGPYILWDVESGEQIGPPAGSENVNIYRPTDDLSKYYRLYQGGGISVHDIITTEEVFALPSVYDIVLNDDGSRALTYNVDNDRVFLWDIQSGSILLEIELILTEATESLNDIGGMGFTPDGDIWVDYWQRYLDAEGALHVDGKIQIYSSEDGREQFTLLMDDGYYYLDFLPNKDYIAMSSTVGPNITASVAFWDLETGEQIGQSQSRIPGYQYSVNPVSDIDAIAFSNQVRVYLVGSADPLVYLDSADTYWTMKFSADGRLLLNAGEDIRLWGVYAD